jgi:DNA recombination protein Rad52
MAFTDQQNRQLKAKLDAQHVKTRKADGRSLHYIEGWHAIAEANRIFGYDGWDRRTLFTNCVWTGTRDQAYLAAYIAKVRIYVRAGEVLIVREGSGTGEGNAPTPGQAHEIALKSAETDATKRALATFGNPFGLALYDRDQIGVRHKSKDKHEDVGPVPRGPWALRLSASAKARQFDKPHAFVRALGEAMTEARDIERLFDIWEHNVQTVREMNTARERFGLELGFAQSLVAHLKSCAVGLAKTTGDPEGASAGAQITTLTRGRSGIDKSALTLAEPKRIRSKEHLRFVARQPCLICGRTPSHAHHIRYAQSKGLGLKVSDEFTVPLCAIHHTQNHATGDERRWWERHKIDPLLVANALWRQGRMPSDSQPPNQDGAAAPNSEEGSKTSDSLSG